MLSRASNFRLISRSGSYLLPAFILGLSVLILKPAVKQKTGVLFSLNGSEKAPVFHIILIKASLEGSVKKDLLTLFRDLHQGD